jgi:hypothetical protein
MRTVDIRKGLGFDSFIFRREQLAQHPWNRKVLLFLPHKRTFFVYATRTHALLLLFTPFFFCMATMLYEFPSPCICLVLFVLNWC